MKPFWITLIAIFSIVSVVAFVQSNGRNVPTEGPGSVAVMSDSAANKQHRGAAAENPAVTWTRAQPVHDVTFYGATDNDIFSDSDTDLAEPEAVAFEPDSDSLVPGVEDPSSDFEALKVKVSEANEEALTQMIDLALYEEKEETRGAAIEFLGSVGQERVMDALIQTMFSHEAWVRAACVRAIGEHGGDRALDALEFALHDPVPEVVEAARFTLNEIGAGEQEAQSWES